MIKTEVIVVGGGPAGAACARRLMQGQAQCLVLDRAIFPRPKPCAGWIPPAVLKLAGATPGSYPFGLTEYQSFEIMLGSLHFRLRTRQYAIRRFEFDHWLLQNSAAPFYQQDVHEIRLEKGQFVVDDAFTAPYLVGAGGTHCPVYRTFFQQTRPRQVSGLIIAQEEEFPYAIQDGRLRLWFFQDRLPGYAWYVPKKDGYLNVGVGGSNQGLRRHTESLKSHWAHLVRRLEQDGLVRDHAWQPVGYSYYLRPRRLRGRIGNAFLAGDALGLATGDMGEGIGPALQSGLLAAEAILTGSAYSAASIPRSSLPSLLGLRREG
jgi:flavin-dependent dehydrogenase